MDFCQRLFPRKIGNVLHQRVTRIIAREGLLNPHDSVVVGISGGADSTALLVLLSESDLSLNCIAAYIDHDLRPHETGAEIETVRRLTVLLGVQFYTRTIPVKIFAKSNGCSTEEAARILRYQVLEAIRDETGATAIAVAHTADDQVEEFLLRMTRGCGREGLAGMRYRRDRIIRPLLEEKKQTLVDFLKERDVSFCLDSSNQDRRFLRNRIRLDLLPALEEGYNPSIRRTILQVMDILKKEDDLLDNLTREALSPLAQIIDRAGTERQHMEIPLALFSGQHPAIKRRMLEELSWKMTARPGFRQIDLLLTLIERGKIGGEIHLGGGLRVRKSTDGLLFFYPRGRSAFRGSGRDDVTIDEQIEAPGIYKIDAIDSVLSLRLEATPASFAQKDRLFVDAEKITFPLRLQSIARGQRFSPFGAGGSKKVSRFLNDRGIPSEKRHFYPTLVMQGQTVAVPGLAIDDAFRITAATRIVLTIEWQKTPPTGAPITEIS